MLDSSHIWTDTPNYQLVLDHDLEALTFSVFQLEDNDQLIDDVYHYIHDKYATLIRYHRWNGLPPQFEIHHHKGRKYLYGVLVHGSNNDQQWLWVYVLYETSKVFLSLYFKIWDLIDHDIMVVKFYHLFDSEDHDTPRKNRLWVQDGKLLKLRKLQQELSLDSSLSELKRERYTVEELGKIFDLELPDNNCLRFYTMESCFDREFKGVPPELLEVFHRKPYLILKSLNYINKLKKGDLEVKNTTLPSVKLALNGVLVHLADYHTSSEEDPAAYLGLLLVEGYNHLKLLDLFDDSSDIEELVLTKDAIVQKYIDAGYLPKDVVLPSEEEFKDKLAENYASEGEWDYNYGDDFDYGAMGAYGHDILDEEAMIRSAQVMLEKEEDIYDNFSDSEDEGLIDDFLEYQAKTKLKLTDDEIASHRNPNFTAGPKRKIVLKDYDDESEYHTDLSVEYEV